MLIMFSIIIIIIIIIIITIIYVYDKLKPRLMLITTYGTYVLGVFFFLKKIFWIFKMKNSLDSNKKKSRDQTEIKFRK